MTDHETILKYIVLYISEHNFIVKWCWKHFIQWKYYATECQTI
jgi:hypothetical protein